MIRTLATTRPLEETERLSEQLDPALVLFGNTKGGFHGKRKRNSKICFWTLRDIYFAEKKILSALPKMAKAARSKELKAAFEKHLKETEGHVDRLDQVFALLSETAKGKTCDAILGTIEEGKEIMDEYKGKPALDAVLLAAAQAVEHYEISHYGTLKTWADELGYNDAARFIEATLEEEKNTDEALTKLAKAEVNRRAAAEVQRKSAPIAQPLIQVAAEQVQKAVI